MDTACSASIASPVSKLTGGDTFRSAGNGRPRSRSSTSHTAFSDAMTCASMRPSELRPRALRSSLQFAHVVTAHGQVVRQVVGALAPRRHGLAQGVGEFRLDRLCRAAQQFNSAQRAFDAHGTHDFIGGESFLVAHVLSSLDSRHRVLARFSRANVAASSHETPATRTGRAPGAGAAGVIIQSQTRSLGAIQALFVYEVQDGKVISERFFCAGA